MIARTGLATLAVILLMACGGSSSGPAAANSPAPSPTPSVVIRAVPPEFPTYPSATYRSGSVATSDCTWIDVKWYSADPVAKVREFYDSRLAEPPWHIISEDTDGITFSGGRNVKLWGRVTIRPTDAGSVISLSGHTTIDAFGSRSQVCDQLYPRETPTPVGHPASP